MFPKGFVQKGYQEIENRKRNRFVLAVGFVQKEILLRNRFIFPEADVQKNDQEELICYTKRNRHGVFPKGIKKLMSV